MLTLTVPRLLIALLGVMLMVQPLSGQDWPSVASMLKTSVFRVTMNNAQGSGSCSAVVFDITADGRAHALTAAHCITTEPNQRLDITVNDRTAQAMISNAILDLGIVRYRPTGGTATVVLADTTPPPGTPVVAAGFAFGVEEIVYQFGHVAQSRNRETKALWLNMDVIFGDSGGGIFDAKGRLIGITSRIFAQGPAHLGGAVSIEDVRAFVDDYKDRLPQLEKQVR